MSCGGCCRPPNPSRGACAGGTLEPRPLSCMPGASGLWSVFIPGRWSCPPLASKFCCIPCRGPGPGPGRMFGPSNDTCGPGEKKTADRQSRRSRQQCLTSTAVRYQPKYGNVTAKAATGSCVKNGRKNQTRGGYLNTGGTNKAQKSRKKMHCVPSDILSHLRRLFARAAHLARRPHHPMVAHLAARVEAYPCHHRSLLLPLGHAPSLGSLIPMARTPASYCHCQGPWSGFAGALGTVCLPQSCPLSLFHVPRHPPLFLPRVGRAPSAYPAHHHLYQRSGEGLRR